MRSRRSSKVPIFRLLKQTLLHGSKKKRASYLIFILLFAALSIYLGSEPDSTYGYYTVDKVIDGDTVVVKELDPHVRYLGIDSPEILTDDSPGDPLSEEAKRFNERLVYGKRVKLEFDREKYDSYGRVLAYVFVDGVFVNEELVRNGLARALVIKPNDRYADVIYRAEEEAKRERKGIWGNLSNLKPPPENTNFLIKPFKASEYVGQRVVVRGKIVDYRKSKKVLVLNMEGDLDIVIFSDNWDEFEFFGIAPERHYVGKPVEVIGRVTVYRGKPQIIVNHPISIRSFM
jgi:micrococcal nuclease